MSDKNLDVRNFIAFTSFNETKTVANDSKRNGTIEKILI